MHQFEVHVQNKVGALAEVAEVLANSMVNIISVATEDRGEGLGIIKLVVDDEKTARKALKLAGFDFDEYEIIGIRLLDKPGELAKLSRALANMGVDIQSVFVLNKDKGYTELALKVSDLGKVKKFIE